MIFEISFGVVSLSFQFCKSFSHKILLIRYKSLSKLWNCKNFSESSTHFYHTACHMSSLLIQYESYWILNVSVSLKRSTKKSTKPYKIEDNNTFIFIVVTSVHRKLYSCIMAYRWFFRNHSLEPTHVYIDNLRLCTKAVDSEQHRSWCVDIKLVTFDDIREDFMSFFDIRLISRCLQRAQMWRCKRPDTLCPKNIISSHYDYNQPLYSIRTYLWKEYLSTVSQKC